MSKEEKIGDIQLPFIEPIALNGNDKRILINGKPVGVDFRVIAEEGYQQLISEITRLRFLATSLPPVEGVSEAKELPTFDIEDELRLSENEIFKYDTFRAGALWCRDKLQSHLSILSLENKELKDALAEEKAACELLRSLCDERDEKVSDLATQLSGARENINTFNNLCSFKDKQIADFCLEIAAQNEAYENSLSIARGLSARLQQAEEKNNEAVFCFEESAKIREQNETQLQELRGLVEEIPNMLLKLYFMSKEEFESWATGHDGTYDGMIRQWITKYNNLKQE